MRQFIQHAPLLIWPSLMAAHCRRRTRALLQVAVRVVSSHLRIAPERKEAPQAHQGQEAKLEEVRGRNALATASSKRQRLKGPDGLYNYTTTFLTETTEPKQKLQGALPPGVC